jgi:purine-nucleoside/S-methyl-5'-thioadenosine phosphorylase / adenosine deaminase
MPDLPLIRWDAPGPYTVAFSTRVGGVSDGPYASLNLGRTTADDPENVVENRRRLCTAVGADPELLAMGYQRHSTTVNRARAGVRDVPGDGLWSDLVGQPMLKLGADCLPVALARVDGEAPALAVAHAGWRGLLDGILQAAGAALGGNLAAVVGPAIGPCCYEVGPEVSEPFAARFGSDLVRGRKLDLWTAAERALREGGCKQVERVDLCTACSPELFFSHRRDNGTTGRQGVIGLVT